MKSTDTLSAAEARRLTLKSQGFGSRPSGRPGRAGLLARARALGAIQIDSVNVLVRAHYLPLFSRLGAYDQAAFDRICLGGRACFFEGWGHEASLMPLDLHPLLAWRRRKAEAGEGIYQGLADFGREEKSFVNQVLGEVAARGPVSAGDLNKGGSTGPWWGWSREKAALEWLFAVGRVMVAKRRGFERLYDLPERVLPPEIINRPEVPAAEARRALMQVSAEALGAATEKELRDYFRLSPAESKAALAELTAEGALVRLEVENSPGPVYAPRGFKIPRSVSASTLLSPFDSLIWNRARTEWLFGFHYRLEFYTPPAKRVYGYLVLPFLNRERLAGRVDLKAERSQGFLRVISVHGEEGAMDDDDLAALALNLGEMARWLSLERVEVEKKGPLARKLAALSAGPAA